MGRGRAKAKQAKVARELKYSSPSMDLQALQSELSGGRSSADRRPDDRLELDDRYDDYRG
ncbi:DUF3073 domain-containing protein [Allokutzneria albata]|uniref:DUF3073 domain-containing protein n=1 Tax=Allokutzneria albata TaxID=211114 RepID=A0A1H0BTY7_ALLAB|nr:DUF3073 domain-containing protein [Allokutzneria albata]SDN49035.1 Protein of unknown function [Allokutzneria albata]